MVAKFRRALSCLSALCLTAATLSGCSGSPGVSSQVVSGVASAGATLAGQVELKDSSGAVQKTAVIGPDGSYSVDVTGLRGPFILQAKGSANGVSYKLNSYAADTGTANVNPLSNVIVASAAGVDDPYQSPDAASLAKIGSGLPGATAALLAKLQPLLKNYAAVGTDPIKGQYQANHQGLDGMLDDVTVTLADGTVTVSNSRTGATIFTGAIADLGAGQFSSDPSVLPGTPALPAAPTGVGASGGTNQVALAWSAVPNATGYNVYWSTQPGVTPGNGTKIAVGTNAYLHAGLSAGTTYYYVVTAVNSSGEGNASAQVSATTAQAPALSVPTAPTGVTATAGSKQVTVAWSAVSGATSYNLYWSTGAGVTTAGGTKVAAASSPAVLQNLADSTTYYVVVTAVNAAGEGVASVQVAATTLAPVPAPTAPAAPTGVTAVGGSGQATISWMPVAGAASYNLYWSTSPGVGTGNGTRVAAVSAPYVLTNLAAGSSYYFVVTAVNAVGESPASTQANAATAAAPAAPAAPTGLAASGGSKQVTVSWGAVSGATSYNLYWSTSSGLSTATGTKITGATSPYLQSGLAAGTGYYYIVTAVNASGESAPSAQASATTAAPTPVLPAAPAGVSATGGSNQISVSWNAVSGATSYNIYYSTASGVTVATGTKVAGAGSPYLLTGLAASTPYYVVVTAVNAAGEGSASAQATATTAAPVASFDGAAYYTANCAVCHGPLGSSDKQGATSAMISAGISLVSGMKKFATLTAAQIDAIAAALK